MEELENEQMNILFRRELRRKSWACDNRLRGCQYIGDS